MPKSDCCNAEVKTEGNTTQYYVCKKCNKACDVMPKTNEEIIEEFEKFCKTHSIRDGVACDLVWMIKQALEAKDRQHEEEIKELKEKAWKYDELCK